MPALDVPSKPDVRKLVEEMKRFQRERGPVLGPGLSIRVMVEEGRRF